MCRLTVKLLTSYNMTFKFVASCHERFILVCNSLLRDVFIWKINFIVFLFSIQLQQYFIYLICAHNMKCACNAIFFIMLMIVH